MMFAESSSSRAHVHVRYLLTMASALEELPSELFRFILVYLTPEDTVALARTCKRLNTMTRDENLWRKFFLQRYEIIHWMDRIHSIQFRYTYFGRVPQYSVEEYLLDSTRRCPELATGCTWQEQFRERAFEDQHICSLFHEMISDRSIRKSRSFYSHSFFVIFRSG